MARRKQGRRHIKIGLTYQEIAEFLDTSPQYAQRMLSRKKTLAGNSELAKLVKLIQLANTRDVLERWTTEST